MSVRLQVLPAAVVLAVAGCASAPAPAPAAPTTPAASTSAAPTGGAAGTGVQAEGTLAPPEQASSAFTYNPALAPEGAAVSVDARGEGATTVVELEVEGLLPDRGYAAHAHTSPCGPTGDAAGPHFQDEVDPAAGPGVPSVDPAYANPENEIWLDLRTDGEGAGASTAEVPFVFGDRAPASVVIHEAEATATEPGRAGSAGARLACLTVPFE